MFAYSFSSSRLTLAVAVLASLLVLQIGGCVSVQTIPALVRAGGTTSMMIGGSEEARKDTTDVTLVSDVNGHQEWDLQALGLVRSVFCLRADGRARGLHYSSYQDLFISWAYGHEPLQTVLVIDLPTDVPVGPASLVVDLNANDDSAGIMHPVTVDLEVIEGTGTPDDFARQDAFSGTLPANFAKLEPTPYAKISFGSGNTVIGAASLVVDFDESALTPDDLNVYVPEATVRGSFSQTGAFGNTQRMAYWHQDGQQLYLDFVAPQGIEQRFLMAYVIHKPNVTAPGFSLVSATLYDVDGNEISISGEPELVYYP